MAETTTLKAGDAFPEGVTFLYVPPTGDLDVTACGLPVKYDASAGMSIFIARVPLAQLFSGWTAFDAARS